MYTLPLDALELVTTVEEEKRQLRGEIPAFVEVEGLFAQRFGEEEEV